MVGVYKITNLKTGDCYIGSSKDIGYRWKQHLYLYNKEGRHYEYHLYRAFREYGIKNFKFEVIELCDEKSRTEKERQYFYKYKPRYNEMIPKDNIVFGEEAVKKHRDNCKKSWVTRSEESKVKAMENLKKGIGNPAFMASKRPKRPIIATNLSDGTETYFDGLCDAEKALGINRSSICQIMNPNHSRVSAKGYTFRYV